MTQLELKIKITDRHDADRPHSHTVDVYTDVRGDALDTEGLDDFQNDVAAAATAAYMEKTNGTVRTVNGQPYNPEQQLPPIFSGSYKH